MSGALLVHRVQCAASGRGCVQALLWESPARRLEDDAAGLRLLQVNGWRLDQGLWVCPVPHDWLSPDPARPVPA